MAEEDRAWEALLAELRRREDAAPEPVRVGLLSLYVGFEEKRRLLARFSGDAAWPSRSFTATTTISGGPSLPESWSAP